jgi:hypothetical protein
MENLLIFTLQLKTSWIKSFHKNIWAQAGVLLSHLVSPYLIPADFFFSGYVNPAFYVPTLHTPLLEFAATIQADAATSTPAMVKTVWGELEYRYNICRGTQSILTEHLQTVQCKSQKLDKIT